MLRIRGDVYILVSGGENMMPTGFGFTPVKPITMKITLLSMTRR